MIIKPIIAPLLHPAACLIIGIVAGRYFDVPLPYALTCFVVLLLTALLTHRWERLQSLSVSTACISLGMLLCLHQQEKLTVAWPAAAGNWQLVVSSEPTMRGKTLTMDALLTETGQKIQLRIMHDERSRQLTVGDGIIAQTTIRPLSAEGGYRTYQETHGYVGEAFVTRRHWQRAVLPLADIGTGARLRLLLMRQRHRLLQQVSTSTEKRDDYAILAAMTLGDKSAVSLEQKEQFAIAGTSHLLALSGLHLGIIYVLLTSLFRSRRLRLLNQLLIVLSIWTFVLLVGMPLSVVRAAIMLSIYAFVSLLNHGKTPVNTLSLTAIIMLVANPYALFDVGFQLSFASVLSILLFMPLLRLPPRYPKPVTFLCHTAIVSIAAQVGTAPLTAYYFGRFSVWFLLANIVSIPLATLILYTMLLTLLLSFWPAAQLLFSVVPTTLALWLNGWTSWIASLPLASIDGLHPSILQVCLLYVIIGGAYYLLRYSISHRPLGLHAG